MTFSYLLEPEFFKVGAVSNAYVAGGTGEPALLFLHGYGGSIVEWDHHIQDLKQDFNCIALDLPGHGKSRISRDALSESAGVWFRPISAANWLR